MPAGDGRAGPAAARAKSLAVLIDAGNTSHHVAHGIFDEVVTPGDASVRRIYGDVSASHLSNWDPVGRAGMPASCRSRRWTHFRLGKVSPRTCHRRAAPAPGGWRNRAVPRRRPRRRPARVTRAFALTAGASFDPVEGARTARMRLERNGWPSRPAATSGSRLPCTAQSARIHEPSCPRRIAQWTRGSRMPSAIVGAGSKPNNGSLWTRVVGRLHRIVADRGGTGENSL